MATDYPSRLDIVPWGSWNTSSGTIVRTQGSALLDMATVSNSSATTGDAVGWSVFLKAGTWSLVTIHNAVSATGDDSVTVTLAATTLGSIDNATANADDQVATIAGFTVATDGIYTLAYTTTDNKVLRLQHITLQRTGA